MKALFFAILPILLFYMVITEGIITLDSLQKQLLHINETCT